MIGWISVVLGVSIGIPQLIKIIRTREVKHISKLTYVLVILTSTGYLYHAIEIGDWVFITSNSLSIIINSIVLGLLYRWDK